MLRNAEVEVVIDLPGVGNNVQEHYNVAVSYRGSISSCFVTMALRIQTELKEEFESEYLTLDCLLDPDELKRQTEL